MTTVTQIKIDVPTEKDNRVGKRNAYLSRVKIEVMMSRGEKIVIKRAAKKLGIHASVLMRKTAIQVAHIILEEHGT